MSADAIDILARTSVQAAQGDDTRPAARPRLDEPVRRALPTPAPQTLGDAFRNRDNNMVLLRVFLAIVVVYSHCYPLALGPGQGDPLSWLTSASAGTGVGAGAGLTSGYFAVCGFFVLSGFVITHSFLKAGSIAGFLIQRARRIYPAFLLAGLVGFFLIAPLAMGVSPLVLIRQFPRYLLDVVLLRPVEVHGVFASNPFPGALNGSLWSIKYEVVCYALVAGLGTIGLLRRPRAALGLFLLATTVYALQMSGLFTPWWPRRVAWLLGEIDQWPRVACYHLAGMTMYLHRNRIPRDGRLAAGAVAMMAVIGAISPAALYVLMPMLMGYATLYVAFGTSFNTVGSRFRKLDLSYGIYLYAFPIQQLIVEAFPETRGQPMLLFALAFPTILLAAIGSRRLLGGSPAPARPARQPDGVALPARLAA